SPPWTQMLAGAAVGVMALSVVLAGWHLMRGDSRPAPAASDAVAAHASVPADGPAAPATPTATARDIGQLLATTPNQHHTQAAFGRLLALWGGYLDPAGSDPCAQALEQGLECVYQQGSWAQLRTLN